MKKSVLMTAFLSLCIVPTLIAGELIWYVAASMTVPAKKMVELYNRQSRTDKILIIVGGSGQLLSKIRLSKKGDIYSPASQHYLETCKTLNLVRRYQPFLSQTPVFGLSTRGQSRIREFSDLSNPGLALSIGNPKTMALGRLYLQIENKMETRQAAAIRENIRLEALNVTQIANYLKRNLIDAGTIFNTVAIAHQIPYIEIPEPFTISSQTYWIELTSGQHPLAVKTFADFLDSNFAVFKRYGFQKAY